MNTKMAAANKRNLKLHENKSSKGKNWFVLPFIVMQF